MINQNPPKTLIMLSSLRFISLAASLTLIAAHSAKAEEILYPVQNPVQQAGSDPAQPPEQQDDWKFTLGAGVMYIPAFIGSKDYQAMVFPDIKVEYKDRFFASPFEGVGYNVINRDGWRAGPIMKFDFGRSEDDDSPFRIGGKKTNALRGLGDMDATPELGGFVEYNYEPFSYTLELRQGVGGHEGLVGEIGLHYMGFTEQLGKPVMYAFGPRVIFADSTYNNAYFGINSTQSTNSGLAGYSADSGLVSYGISAFVVMSVSESVSLGVFGGYDRLGSEAADSPLIKERGDENQFMGGVRISYEFGY
jgi:outer membrane scaffolding protein for murein synthesis (MipA/OmpV family)